MKEEKLTSRISRYILMKRKLIFNPSGLQTVLADIF